MRPSWSVYAGAVPPCLLIQTNAPTSPGARTVHQERSYAPEVGALSEYQSLINSCIGLNRPGLLRLHLFR